ncbi:hypothetical protein FUAX_09570 [Fulvitalea axinellae]|uniref:FAD-binding FR-type domain-containing protein n=1 Tax=Fulvitalea axinellae TaxID=1182444 RepID=A0AAU9CH15_9BACT|nr:hypothetical protein FUAX_09570 [Fulvitalea axinellae]
MSNYDAVIIGGGLGGLTTGAILSKKGKRVLLLEQHYVPGGCATTFKRKDYLMEVGLHAMDTYLCRDIKRELFDTLGVTDNVEFLQTPEFYRYIGGDIDFVLPEGGREKALKKLGEMFPEDRKGLNKLFDFIFKILEELPRFPVERWKYRLMFPTIPFLFPGLTKATYGATVGEWLDKNIKNEKLKLILLGNIFYYHDDPYTASMVYFGLGQASYFGGGGHFIKGGSQKLSDHLAKVINENGGKVLLGKKATEILIKNGKASGVVFRNAFDENAPSERADADVVIGNAAMPAVAEMLPSPQKEKIKKTMKGLKPFNSLITVYIGFKKTPKSLGWGNYSTMVGSDKLQSIKGLADNLKGVWSERTFTFLDYSQIDSGLAPEGKSVGTICSVDHLSAWEGLSDEEYATRKEEAAHAFFDRMEKYLPGFRDAIDYYEVGTAKTLARFTGNTNASPYGWAQMPGQTGMSRPHLQSPVKGLYFASAWTFPGGGFTGAILSAYYCAKLLEGKVDSAETPVPYDDGRVVKLIERKEVAEDTMELVFEKPEDFRFEAGQYAVLQLDAPADNSLDMAIRRMSIASHADDSDLRFAMRKSSSAFKRSCDQMTPGDTATIYSPMGDFVLEEDSENIVFLIAGIGVTPVLPMLKELEKRNHKGRVTLFYSNRHKEEAAYHKRFEAVSLKGFQYVPIITGTEGRLNRQLMEKHLGDLRNHRYYMVGTSGFLTSMSAILDSAGVEPQQVYCDDFG